MEYKNSHILNSQNPTRMHSSRLLTAHSLTACHRGGGVYGRGVCVVGGIHGREWCAWQGACKAWGACMTGGHMGWGGLVGGGHVWQGGMSGGGGMCGRPGTHGRGHAWQGAYVAGGVCGRGVCITCIPPAMHAPLEQNDRHL